MSTYKKLKVNCLPQPIGPVGTSPYTVGNNAPGDITDVTLTGSGALMLQTTTQPIYVRFTPAGEALGSPSVGTGDVVIQTGGQRVFAIQAGDRISMLGKGGNALVTMSYCREG